MSSCLLKPNHIPAQRERLSYFLHRAHSGNNELIPGSVFSPGAASARRALRKSACVIFQYSYTPHTRERERGEQKQNPPPEESGGVSLIRILRNKGTYAHTLRNTICCGAVIITEINKSAIVLNKSWAICVFEFFACVSFAFLLFST